MLPDFGVGLRSFLFEPKIDAIPAIRQRIEQQVRKYMPYLKINNVSFDSGYNLSQEDPIPHKLNVSIDYSIPQLNFNTTLILQSEEMN